MSEKDTKEYWEGMDAYKAGKEEHECPYASDPERSRWLSGWYYYYCG